MIKSPHPHQHTLSLSPAHHTQHSPLTHAAYTHTHIHQTHTRNIARQITEPAGQTNNFFFKVQEIASHQLCRGGSERRGARISRRRRRTREVGSTWGQLSNNETAAPQGRKQNKNPRTSKRNISCEEDLVTIQPKTKPSPERQLKKKLKNKGNDTR